MSDPHAHASTPADDEPKTPMWLPALGAALFVSVGLWWAVTPSSAPAAQAASLPSATATAPATAAPQPAQPVRIAPTAPTAAGTPPARPAMNDDAQMQQKLKELRDHFGAQHGLPTPAGGAKAAPPH